MQLLICSLYIKAEADLKISYRVDKCILSKVNAYFKLNKIELKEHPDFDIGVTVTSFKKAEKLEVSEALVDKQGKIFDYTISIPAQIQNEQYFEKLNYYIIYFFDALDIILNQNNINIDLKDVREDIKKEIIGNNEYTYQEVYDFDSLFENDNQV